MEAIILAFRSISLHISISSTPCRFLSAMGYFVNALHGHIFLIDSVLIYLAAQARRRAEAHR